MRRKRGENNNKKYSKSPQLHALKKRLSLENLHEIDGNNLNNSEQSHPNLINIPNLREIVDCFPTNIIQL